jgi:hypothetical protein
MEPEMKEIPILALALAGAVFVADVLPGVAGERQVQIAAGQSCCKVCSTGKACGNSCISAKRTCRKPRGCACNG